MASLDVNLSGQNTENLTKSVKLCTFCNNSTNGFDKWLYATQQDKSPFFPILAEIRGEDTVFDDLGRTLVCVACFHHLLRQWSSYERRCIPLKKRQYNLIGEEKLSNFQIKREEEIRKEGELKLREIKLREDKIKKEAQERLELLRQKEQNIREEAGKRLIEEEEELEEIKREAARQLKEEKGREEELKRLLEEEIRLERQKGDYIRKEAERLLREQTLLQSSRPPANVRTEFLIHSPQGRAFDQIPTDHHLDENTDDDDDVKGAMEPNRRLRSMEYDPVSGCYVRKVPLDFSDKKVEDIVKEEMIKTERKTKSRSSDPGWKKSDDKESGSASDTALVDLSFGTSDQNGDKSLPYYVSGEGMETEYKFSLKQETKTESQPAGFDKNDDDRMKFERDSGDVTMSETSKRYLERRRRSDEDPDSKKSREDAKDRTLSLDRKLKDMEERRARLFKGSPEEKADKTDAGEVTITRTVTTEKSYSSPASEDSMLGERMQDAHRRHRNREERIKRRKNAEELISKKTSEDDNKPKSPPMKSTGVKLELRGTAIKKREDDSSSKGDSEANAFSGSNHSYRHQDEPSDIAFTVKKTAETKKDEDGIQAFDKKETTFDWNEKEQKKSSSRTTETKYTSGSLMDEPIVWSQRGSERPGRGESDDISFTFKESSRTKKDVQDKKDEKPESKTSKIKEAEVKVVESKPVQSLFSSDFGKDEPQDIVFSIKEASSSTPEGEKDDSDSSKSKPKELTLERGTFDEKYSFTSTSNSDLLRWEMDNVDSGGQPSEPDTGSFNEGYRDSLRRTNALGRVGSFKKGRDELPPAVFHDIESDAPSVPVVDIRTESPLPLSRDSTKDVKQGSERNQDTILGSVRITSQAPDVLSQLQDEDIDDERRRRRQEIEEKKRKIAERQKNANVQLRRNVSDTEKNTGGTAESESSDTIEDLSEKRRSLLMMWEQYAEGEGPGPENRDPDQERKSQPFGYDVMMREAAQSDPNARVVDYRTMDAEDDKEERRTPMVDIDEYHKLNDDELKWERAGQFQPGKLDIKFHEIGKDEPPSEPRKTWQGMNNNTSDVTSKVIRDEQRFNYKTPVVEDQSYVVETTEVESAPKPLWDENEGQSTYKSDDEEEKDTRKPHVDVDEVHHMTEEESRWEKVGHFQPGKINTSVFESRRKADQNGSVDSSKIQKREKSRYEQIKKIQRTDSKKELLVPKKVALRADRPGDLEEEVEIERPHVGKIETPLFQGTVSEDERQRREREARNRREMEEIEREKEEERRRQEREYLESKTSVNEFEDDEFDVKVKSKDVRKIDITKFGDFQKSSEPIQEVKPASKQSTKRIVESRREDKVESVTKTTTYGREDDGFDIQVRHRSVGKLSMDSSPFIQHDTPLEEANQPRKVQESTLSKRKEIVVEESPMEMASPPGKLDEDELDNMARARHVKKLDISRFPFSRDDKCQDNRQVVENKALKRDKDKSQDKSLDKTSLLEDRKREREREKREWEKQLKRERDEIEQMKKAHDKTFQDDIKGGIETNDTNVYETETRNVRKLDLSNFSKFQQGDADQKKPVRKTSNKDSKRGYVQQADVVVAETTREVESAPDYGYQEDEYEIKRRSVGKLNKDWLYQAQEQEAREAEFRRKEAEMERVRKEQYEIEQLKMEERKRRETEEDEVLRDDPYSSEKPQSVKKLDSNTMSPFLKGGRPSQEGSGGLTRRKSKDEVRQERKLARKESRSKMQSSEVLHAEETDNVQQSPESVDDRPREVRRLNTGKYLQMMGEDLGDKERRKKLLEEERMKRELEEMERQKEEEERRKEMERDDSSSSSSSDKPQSVNKLDLSQFSQFQKKDTVGMHKKQRTKEITREPKKESRIEFVEKQTVAEVESEPLLPETSEREWLERERNEAIQYEEKRQNVGRLDVNRIMQSRSEEEQERQSRIKELERQRIIKEREEMERLKAEKKGEKSVDSEISSGASREDHKAPSITSSNSQRDREREEEWTVEEKRKSGVGRLNVDHFMQSLSKEEEEKNRRKIELEKERIRQEAEERERLRMEQQVSSESIKVSSVQEVHSAPDDGLFYERGNREGREREEELAVEEKRKSVGRLDVNKFVQSLSEEADEKSRRKTELERERIRRENEERELLRLEQERNNRGKGSSSTSSDESSRKYVIVHRDSKLSGGQQDERRERETWDEEKYSSLEREREEELSVEEKRKSVGRLDVNKFVQSLSQEEEEKRRRTIELERERRRREEEEKELLRLEQERGRRDEVSRSTSTKSSYEQISRTVVQDVHSSPYDQVEDIQHPSKIDKWREEEESVEEKRKSVGRLDVNKFVQSLSQEEEEKRRRTIELERERRRREEEEKELLRLEQERGRGDEVSRSTSTKSSYEQISRTVVQDVHSSPYDQDDEDIQHPSRIDKEREEELSVEEKRKSVGRLDVNKFVQSLSQEEEEKRRRMIELERERRRREEEEKELLRLEQNRSRSVQSVEQVNASVVQEVHSAPSQDITDTDKRSSLEREREEAMSVEEKRKSVGRLDFNQFLQSLSEEDREKQMKKIELERERTRREQEEREMEEKQFRLRESSSYSENIQSSSVEVVHSEIPVEYEDTDSSQDRKEVGRLDLERYSQQFNQEARERQSRVRELEIERLRLEREEMEGRGGSQTVEHESWSSERRETTTIDEKRKYRVDEVDKRSEGQTESVKSDESSDSDKPVPKRLDLSKFSAFHGGSGKRVTKDDSAVKRREKSEAGRQSRPKSFAGSSFGGVANGDAKSGERMYQIRY